MSDYVGVAAGMAGFAMRSAMAAIFLIAALHALRDRDEFALVVHAYRILPEWLTRRAAIALPPIECAVALALLIPQTRFLGGLAGLALLACFSAAIAINLVRGRRDIECGCGGGTGQTISINLLLRNGLLFAGLAASLAAPAHALPTAGLVGAVGMASFLTALYLAANQLLANAKAWPA